VYSINATFVTSCNTTKVCALDVIVAHPPILMPKEFQSLVYILHFLGGVETWEMTDWMNLLCWYIFIIMLCDLVMNAQPYTVSSLIYILVRNQIQMYNKKYPVNAMWLLEQNKCRIKKKTLTGQRRNTIILKHLMFQSCDYPHFICISFRQFDCYIYIILWAPYICLCIFTFNIHLLVSAI
jgi:hypothetical protein